MLRYASRGERLFDVRATTLVEGEVKQRVTERVRARAGLAFLLALVVFRHRRLARYANAVAARSPRSRPDSRARRSFRSTSIRISRGCSTRRSTSRPRGGPLTGNAGALATTERDRPARDPRGVSAAERTATSRWGASATVLLVAGLGPFLLRELARGVQIPLHGVDATLWLIWEIPLFLAAVSVLLAGAAAGAAIAWAAPWPVAVGRAAGRDDRGGSRARRVGSPGAVAVVVRVSVGWRDRHARAEPAQPLASSSARRPSRRSAPRRSCGAARRAVASTPRCAISLVSVRSIPSRSTLLRRFGKDLDGDYAPESRQALLQHFVISDLASAGNPVELSAWPTDTGAVARFRDGADSESESGGCAPRRTRAPDADDCPRARGDGHGDRARDGRAVGHRAA